ncbi:ABC-type metal ion transport system, periplasmic component/surface adhesin [Leptolyngbyaceae cyanobacterium JSC-12]|nr:ABC-type metal ion transport system, periplasmic component/surface adhesin [Leptolyngbyaceae cyanobacterium JSC-12]
MQMIDQSRTYLQWIIVGCLLATGLLGCTQPNSTQPEAVGTNSNNPKVVSTSTIIADWSQEVGGNEIEHISILQPGADPHVYEPTPQDTRAFEEARLILYNGYNLEPGLIRLMKSSGKNAKQVAVGEVVQSLQMNKEGKGRVPDPHVWGDVKNAIAIVNRIRDELIELSPEDTATFTQNAAKLTTELKQLDQWIKQQIQTIPANQRQLVTTHDAFQYYANAYGLKVAGTLIGISTEEQPSAQTVRRLVEAIKATRTPAIFAETTINPTLIETVANTAGVKLASQKLYSDSIGAPGSNGDSYIKMMVANTTAITENLGGKVTPFQPNPE